MDPVISYRFCCRRRRRHRRRRRRRRRINFDIYVYFPQHHKWNVCNNAHPQILSWVNNYIHYKAYIPYLLNFG